MGQKFCTSVKDPWCYRKVLCGCKRPQCNPKSYVDQKNTHDYGYPIVSKTCKIIVSKDLIFDEIAML